MDEVHDLLRSEFLLELPSYMVIRILMFLLRKKLITKAWRRDGQGFVCVYYKIVTSPSFHSHTPKWRKTPLLKSPLFRKDYSG